MNVVVIKYNAGNTKSVINALERIGVQPILTDKPELIASADRVIFPGVGHAKPAMEYLKSKGLDLIIRTLKQPTLGICLGMQLMFKKSEEGNVDGMGIFDGEVIRFPSEPGLKIPHMGWTETQLSDNPLFAGLNPQEFYYHVHSYFIPSSENAIAKSKHGTTEFVTAVEKNNFYAVQFHPEKSGKAGSRIIENFINLPWK
ncbi:imidazole glycerol phosphate synthase subunit HisH [Luteibaculum oceani]|uniref:Imidazole glycerol phosphate synthase subunit HisH n=1 Tax=Luteibaculum oceani TaxID=1294296 RepID=A0A5C6VEE6_9FLAO|nr:imidazole glycerol phosphate synthase subunit HisH [Luteibaculum oceani]TXC81478.1 imidazole glycerol phosphate synthase subunit HisH [Luteibaculum oceani]